MKKLFLGIALLISLLACKNNTSSEGSINNEENKEDKAEKDKKITKRDFSITPANSYNDLFLDSTVVEKFIAEKKLNDTLTRRIRSFYNARNYQFAWFSSAGLAEQAREFWNLYQYHTTENKTTAAIDKSLKKKMNAMVIAEDVMINASDKSSVNTELLLTQHFYNICSFYNMIKSIIITWININD